MKRSWLHAQLSDAKLGYRWPPLPIVFREFQLYDRGRRAAV